MPYYAAGDYYQGGDNYHRAGDFLGIGKALKKLQPGRLLGGIARRVLGNVPIVGGLAASLVPGISNNAQRPLILAPGGAPEPGIAGIVHRALPGGESGYLPRRRINPLNVKALRRAGRRVKGFLKIASRLGALPVNRGKGKTLFKRKRKA